jgi:hypothetical protein
MMPMDLHPQEITSPSLSTTGIDIDRYMDYGTFIT